MSDMSLPSAFGADTGTAHQRYVCKVEGKMSTVVSGIEALLMRAK
jgi:hypothetical protein